MAIVMCQMSPGPPVKRRRRPFGSETCSHRNRQKRVVVQGDGTIRIWPTTASRSQPNSGSGG
jgi:hypothetical protein